ncbi:hypothetical protein BSKO_07180 [Bryopsis sp. KO-2023]|nr:hypothetical protein BSKO_07180 [Bryopsis sp. KO-2023]
MGSEVGEPPQAEPVDYEVNKKHQDSSLTSRLRRRLSIDRPRIMSSDGADLQQELQDANRKLERATSHSETLVAQLDKVKSEKEKLVGDVTEAMKTINRLTAMSDEYKQKLQEAESDKADLSEEVALSQDRVMDVFRENEDLRIKVLDSAMEMEKIRKELKLLTLQNQTTMREKEELEKKLSRASRPLFGFGRHKGQPIKEPTPVRIPKPRRHSVEVSQASQNAWQRRFCGLMEDEES